MKKLFSSLILTVSFFLSAFQALAAESISLPSAHTGNPSTFTDVYQSGAQPVTTDSASDTFRVTFSATSGTIQLTTTTGLSAVTGYPSSNWTSGTATEIAFTGSLTDVNNAATSLQYKGTEGVLTASVLNITAGGDASYYAETGSYYKFVNSNQTWNNARTAARGTTLNGIPGYLATVTSAAEFTFIKNKAGASQVWLGGTDSASEGVWRWIDDPGVPADESGVQFWQGTSTGYATNGMYTAWNSGEPNDSGSNEDALQIESSGNWNDLPTNSSLLPYVIEYTPSASDGSLATLNVQSATAPTLTSSNPSDGAISVGPSDNIVLTFSEAVSAGSGNVTIHKVSDDSVVATLSVTNTGLVSISSNIVTLNPSSDLSLSTDYYVLIDQTAFDAVDDGASFAGISSSTALNFTTASPQTSSPPSAVYLVDWNTANNSTYTSGATLNARTVTVSTPAFGNSGDVYAGNWASMLGSGVAIDTNNDQGFSVATLTTGATTSISFSAPVTNPMVLFNWTDSSATTYDFSATTGTGSFVSVAANSGSGSATAVNNVVSTSGYANTSGDGFLVRLTGTFTAISFTATSGSNDTIGFSVGLDGYSVTTSIGANGSATVSGNTLSASSTTTQVVEASGSETLTYAFSAVSHYALDTVNSSTTCGGTIGTSYTTSAITSDCAVSAVFTPSAVWADWTSIGSDTTASVGSPSAFTYVTSATGTLIDASTGATVNLSQTGEVVTNFSSISGFSQWTDSGAYYPVEAFDDASIVSPAVGNEDILMHTGYTDQAAKSHTITFDKTVSGLVMGIWSLGGQGDATMVFSDDFEIVDTASGTASSGSGIIKGTDSSNGYTVTGGNSYGYNGLIQFYGDFGPSRPLTYTIIDPEYYFGMNIASTTRATTAASGGATVALDTSAPVLSSSSPADDATDVAVGSNITLTFDEPVEDDGGSITLYDANDTLVQTFTGFTISGDGLTITLDPTNDLVAGQGYYINIASNAVKDALGNRFGGISDKTTLNFTTALSTYTYIDMCGIVNDNPVIAAAYPVVTAGTGNSGTGIPFTTCAYTGSGGMGSLILAGANTAPAGAPSTIEINVPDSTGLNTFYALLNNYYGTVGANEYTVAVNYTDGTSQSFNSIGGTDTRDFHQNVSTSNTVGANTTTWWSNYTAGATSYERLDVRQFDISAGSAKTVKSVTLTQVHPTDSAMLSGLTFTTNTMGTLADADPDTTAPTLTSSSPADNSGTASVSDNITLTFSENILATGSGNITLFGTSGAVQVFDPADTANVTISGNTVTLNPTNNLSYGASYYIQITSDALKDAAGNTYAGISDATTLNFSIGHFVDWVDWTMPGSYPKTGDVDTYASGTTGTVSNPASSTTVNVTLTGEVMSKSADSFSSWNNSESSNGEGYNVDSNFYSPAGEDLIAQTGFTDAADRAHTITFDQNVTGVVMGIWSLGGGQPSTLVFSDDFEIFDTESTGGMVRVDTALGYELRGGTGGADGSAGLIQFCGTFGPSNPLTYTVTDPEYYSGMNVAITTRAYTGGTCGATKAVDVAAPVITGPSGEPGDAASSIDVLAEQTAVTQFTADETVIWSITGGANSADFDLASDGTITFKTAPSFDAVTASNNVYVVEVQAKDEIGNISKQTLTVNVLPSAYPNEPGSTEEDEDGDGAKDSDESTTADRDGDGIVDSQDYDPQGYFYCQADGRILSGGKVSVSGPGNVTMVHDGSETGDFAGNYQWFVDAPGTYTMTIDTSGMEFGTIAKASSGTMTIADFSGNPVVIGSTENGTTGYLGDYNGTPYDPANPTDYYTTFVIAAGDPNVFANNIPFQDCAIPEDIVEQTVDVLNNDMRKAVDAQQATIASTSKSALQRLRSGYEQADFCGAQDDADIKANGRATAADVNLSGMFEATSYDCVKDRWVTQQGSMQVSTVDGFGMQYALNYTQKSEGFVSDSEVFGRFFGAYATQSNVTGTATGQIQGFGANAGFYGAKALEQEMYLDYYVGGAFGSHGFTLAFPLIDDAVDVDGRYSYGAIMSGFALSAETQDTEAGEISLLPRVGVDAVYAQALSGDMTATLKSLTESSTFTLDTYRRLRGYAELQIETLSAESVEGGYSLGYALTPRVICDLVSPATQATCGYGATLTISQSDPANGTHMDVTLRGEKVGTTTTVGLDASRRKEVLNGAGVVTSTMGANQDGSFNLVQTLELKF